jgi:hypothetical protein
MQIRAHAVPAGAMPRESFAIATPRKASSLWLTILRATLTTVAIVAVSCLAIVLSLS